MAVTAYSYLTLPLQVVDYSYLLFVGASTLLLYSLHRIIGIKKSETYSEQGRFAIIIKYKSHLIIYSIVSGIYCLYAYYTFDWNRRLHLIIPAILSLSYSLPIFFGGKRLRDFHWIKIFLIAICWAVITNAIPYYEILTTYSDTSIDYTTLLLTTVERAIFLFAITIPFDIRDRDVDRSTDVFTLATRYNDLVLKRISWSALLIASLISILLFNQDLITFSSLLPILLTYFLSAYLVHLTNEKRSDYFFTGLMDGTMILPIFFVLLYVLAISILT